MQTQVSITNMSPYGIKKLANVLHGATLPSVISREYRAFIFLQIWLRQNLL